MPRTLYQPEDVYERAAYRAPLGRELHRPDSRVVERPGWYQIITPSAAGHLNEVYISRLAPEEADAAIDEVVADYASRPGRAPVKWCVGPWTEPKDFRERLLARGFTATAVRAMACSTDLRLEVPTGITVREVTIEDIDGLVAFEARGWGMPDDERDIERETHVAALTASPRTAHFFAARVDGAIIASCGIFLREDFGYLVGGLVAPEARGRGIYRALVDARLAFLRGRGISLAVTHARDATSSPMLEHLGFRTVYSYECSTVAPTARYARVTTKPLASRAAARPSERTVAMTSSPRHAAAATARLPAYRPLHDECDVNASTPKRRSRRSSWPHVARVERQFRCSRSGGVIASLTP